MDMQKLGEIVKKNIDIPGLEKDLLIEFVKAPLMAFKAKVESGEVDLIKGTDLDKGVLIKAIDLILEKI